MRLARSLVLALMLTLALAPVASAHDEDAPDHRDTPADLAAANINRTLAVAHLTGTTAPDLPEFLPTDACGQERTGDDTIDAAFPATQRQIKVVYAYAGDPVTNDHFAVWQDALQANVSRIQQFLALQTGGRRALSFDMGTECGPQYLDVQSVHLPSARSAYVSGSDSQNFFALANDVRTAVGVDSRDVLILADDLSAYGSSFGVWGIAQVTDDDSPGSGNDANVGGLTGMMLVPGGTAPDPQGWQPTVMLHEITHNLGGVQLSAPHATSNSHCIDGEDVMCYEDGSPEAANYRDDICSLEPGAIAQTYDCGHDDYFNPDPAAGSYLATHWNVYSSAFMGRCSDLGMACGSHIVTTLPVNTTPPAVTGEPQRGIVLTASAGTWFNAPTTYALQWQRNTAGGWANIAGAAGGVYTPTADDVGAALRVVVTAANSDGSAVAASGPTAPVADYATVPLPVAKAADKRTVHIALRDRAHRKAGTLAAVIRVVPEGREVRTAAVRVALPAGTWRLKLCAGPKRGALRCALSARVRTRKRGVRLPSARVIVKGSSGALRLSAAAVDGRLRVRAKGQAATSR
jgi:hypothetical protein